MIFKGDTVQFLGGWNQEQLDWAQTNAPSALVVDQTYVAEAVEVKPHATRIKLVGVEGVFSSVHFRVV